MSVLCHRKRFLTLLLLGFCSTLTNFPYSVKKKKKFQTLQYHSHTAVIITLHNSSLKHLFHQRVSYFICIILFKDTGLLLILHKEPSNCLLSYGNKKYKEGMYVQKDNSWLSNQSPQLVVKLSGICEWLWKTTKLIYVVKISSTGETTATAVILLIQNKWDWLCTCMRAFLGIYVREIY